MNNEQRANMIATLIWITGYNEQLFEKMDDKELNEFYLKRMEGRK